MGDSVRSDIVQKAYQLYQLTLQIFPILPGEPNKKITVLRRIHQKIISSQCEVERMLWTYQSGPSSVLFPHDQSGLVCLPTVPSPAPLAHGSSPPAGPERTNHSPGRCQPRGTSERESAKEPDCTAPITRACLSGTLAPRKHRDQRAATTSQTATSALGRLRESQSPYPSPTPSTSSWTSSDYQAFHQALLPPAFTPSEGGCPNFSHTILGAEDQAFLTQVEAPSDIEDFDLEEAIRRAEEQHCEDPLELALRINFSEDLFSL